MAPQSNIVHVVPIIEELQRIADSDLRTALNLVSVNIGDLNSMPAPAILEMCPGIWIKPSPAMTNEFDLMPKPMLQKYYFRIVYARLIQPDENIVKKAMQDVTLIINTYSDKLQLPDLTNIPSGTHILWVMTKSVEWQPPEDDYVTRVHADLTAIAFNLEVNCMTRRAV